VRQAACGALGQIGSKRAVGPLIESLRDPWVRWVAYRALWRIEWKNIERLRNPWIRALWLIEWNIRVLRAVGDVIMEREKKKSLGP